MSAQDFYGGQQQKGGPPGGNWGPPQGPPPGQWNQQQQQGGYYPPQGGPQFPQQSYGQPQYQQGYQQQPYMGQPGYGGQQPNVIVQPQQKSEGATGCLGCLAGACLCSWVSWFLSTKGNEYFCEVDEEYILDRFNLTGLNVEVQHYSQALDLITDSIEEELNEDSREAIESSARHLYGLIHARFIITSRGLSKMVDKYKKADFGRCPRVLCYGQALLPVGLSDLPYQKAVKLYCPRCEDIYSPKSSRHGTIDGAYFGSTFPHMLFMVHPQMVPAKSISPGIAGGAAAGASAATQSGQDRGGSVGGAGTTAGGQTGGPNAALKAERYRPRIFGFMLHETARVQRWQEAVRDRNAQHLHEVMAEEG